MIKYQDHLGLLLGAGHFPGCFMLCMQRYLSSQGRPSRSSDTQHSDVSQQWTHIHRKFLIWRVLTWQAQDRKMGRQHNLFDLKIKSEFYKSAQTTEIKLTLRQLWPSASGFSQLPISSSKSLSSPFPMFACPQVSWETVQHFQTTGKMSTCDNLWIWGLWLWDLWL